MIVDSPKIEVSLRADAWAYASSWRIEKDGAGVITAQPRFSNPSWWSTPLTLADLQTFDSDIPNWLETALTAHSELVLTGAQLHHGADFWTCGSLAVPISAMPPLTPTGNRLKRVVEVTAFHNTEHDLMFEQAAWYETKDPSLNVDYPDLRLRGSFWVTHAWLDQHHPGWESRLLVATALDMPVAELLSSVFPVDFPGATSLPHAKATVELPHTELGATHG